MKLIDSLKRFSFTGILLVILIITSLTAWNVSKQASLYTSIGKDYVELEKAEIGDRTLVIRQWVDIYSIIDSTYYVKTKVIVLPEYVSEAREHDFVHVSKLDTTKARQERYMRAHFKYIKEALSK